MCVVLVFETTEIGGSDLFLCLQDGHLKMLDGYLEFFMKPALAETYLSLKKELEELIQCKVSIFGVLGFHI